MEESIKAFYKTICKYLDRDDSIEKIVFTCEVLQVLIDTYYAYHEWKEGYKFPEKEGTYMSVSMDDNDWDHICKHCQERVLPTSTGQYYCPSCNGFVEAIRDSNKFTEKKENHKCPSCE